MVTNKEEGNAVFNAVMEMPELQRTKTFKLLIHKYSLLSLRMNGLERAAIIRAASFIPKELQDSVLVQVSQHCRVNRVTNGLEISKIIVLKTSQMAG